MFDFKDYHDSDENFKKKLKEMFPKAGIITTPEIADNFKIEANIWAPPGNIYLMVEGELKGTITNVEFEDKNGQGNTDTP